MAKRKALTPSNHGRKDDFIHGSIYRTTHRKYAVIGRSTEHPSNKKRRTPTPTKLNNDNSSKKKKKKTYFVSTPDDPGLMRLQGNSTSKTNLSSPQFTITPALPTKARRGGFKSFPKTHKNTPPSLLVGENKFLFLVEGIHRETGSRYDYLSEIYMHGVVDALPTRGCSTEILPLPMAPGRWKLEDVGCTASVIQNQSDWEGKRVVLRHEDYEPPTRDNPKQQFRVTHVDRPHNGDIGSVSLVAFDGFVSSEERLYNQSELGMTVQKTCRSQQWINQPIVLLPPFQHGCWSSSGGVSAAVRVGSDGLGTYYLKITSCEKSNQIVATEIVFCSLGAKYANTESVCNSPSAAPLTARNLKHHVVKTQQLSNPKEVFDPQSTRVHTKTPRKAMCSDQVKSWTPSEWKQAASNGLRSIGAASKVLSSPTSVAHKNNLALIHKNGVGEMHKVFSFDSGSSVHSSAKESQSKDRNSTWEDHEPRDVFFDPLSPSRSMEGTRDEAIENLHVLTQAEVTGKSKEDRATCVFSSQTSNEHEQVSMKPEIPFVETGDEELPLRATVCLHDVLFGVQEDPDHLHVDIDAQEASWIATDWTVGAVLMLLFALSVRFFYPALLELTEANYPPVLPDLDAILHAGEGFAEFVYVNAP